MNDSKGEKNDLVVKVREKLDARARYLPCRYLPS